MKNFKSFQGSDALRCVPERQGRPYQGEGKPGTLGSVSVRALSIALALFAGLFYASAQPYTIDWYTVDGGGVMDISGGTYSLSGTIGQPDAGRMLGGNDSIDGGFWGLIALVPPRLTITRSGNNVIICWPSPSTGFKLQQSVGLAPATWTDVGQAPVDNGTTKCVTLPITSMTFYRLTN
jgi:hypothetical protein